MVVASPSPTLTCSCRRTSRTSASSRRPQDPRHVVDGLRLATFLVWITAFQTGAIRRADALVGLVALAALASLGLERWRLTIRFLLPAMGLCGILVAIQQNVVAVHWT